MDQLWSLRALEGYRNSESVLTTSSTARAKCYLSMPQCLNHKPSGLLAGLALGAGRELPVTYPSQYVTTLRRKLRYCRGKGLPGKGRPADQAETTRVLSTQPCSSIQNAMLLLDFSQHTEARYNQEKPTTSVVCLFPGDHIEKKP